MLQLLLQIEILPKKNEVDVWCHGALHSCTANDLLPFYAILRSIPNKIMGVVAMLCAILAILLLPVVDLGKSKGFQFRPLTKITF